MKRLLCSSSRRPFTAHSPRAFASSREALSALVGLATLTGALLIGAPAQAQTRGFTWNETTASGGLRFGTKDLNLGLGARGGHTLGQGIYLGGSFDYFFGNTETSTLTDLGSGTQLATEVDFDAWFLMFEGGYDLGLARRFVLRPMLGLGFGHGSVSICQTLQGVADQCRDETDDNGAFQIGALAIYDLRPVTLSGGLRIFIGDVDGVVFGASVGGSF